MRRGLVATVTLIVCAAATVALVSYTTAVETPNPIDASPAERLTPARPAPIQVTDPPEVDTAEGWGTVSVAYPPEVAEAIEEASRDGKIVGIEPDADGVARVDATFATPEEAVSAIEARNTP